MGLLCWSGITGRLKVGKVGGHWNLIRCGGFGTFGMVRVIIIGLRWRVRWISVVISLVEGPAFCWSFFIFCRNIFKFVSLE